ncbi:ERF family protein [Sphingopyxis sp. JAI128]|uniref:ERF family protein n=1 Tax=Sphingopyxis sp. JAI128 TaxID=2723066 RepID=UPI0017EE7BD0|nr:ERF family protein [Sphingopyxis sp. JAI128]MBB6424989.1 hypothetical protein [Sphingopyxis sp. JAI128]
MTAVQKVEAAETAVANYSASLMDVIAQAARDPSVDIDKMERLIAMQERVQGRDAQTQYYSALAEMQPNLPIIDERGGIKGRDGTIQSTYALWEDVNEAIRPTLAEHGFSLSFRVSRADGEIIVTGILAHRSGHREETTLSLPTDTSGSKNAVQAVGSSTSYGKRYTAFALLNITTTGEDDDGNKAGMKKIVHETARDAPFPQGPARNKTDLKTKAKVLWQDVEASGDMDTLDIVLNDNSALIEQLKTVLPSWWHGGKDEGGMAFEGLGQIVRRMKRDFSQGVN